jgi:Sulfotransferase domain
MSAVCERIAVRMRKPDFFIVGAPKCGTTAMTDYLKQHPEIFIPERKEIYFFGSDLLLQRARPTEQEYYSYFTAAKDEKRVGEASVFYLYSSLAATEIKAFCSSARILIMLRNPIDMMYALHSQRLYSDNENIDDFEQALEAEEDRKRGLRIYKKARNVVGSLYRSVAHYAQQVKRYCDVFGREQVHIVIFDDLKDDSAQVYRNTCAFLEVDTSFLPKLRIVNANKRIRSKTISNFLHYPPPAIRWLLPLLGLRPAPHTGFEGWLKNLNTKYGPRPRIRPELRKRLLAEFEPEVQQLSELLGRDLSHWCRKEDEK